MFTNIWNYILDWFRERSERSLLICDFNENARAAFILGSAPILMKAKVSRGDSNYRHQFSDWLNSGFRITVLQGRALSKQEVIDIGNAILANAELVRRLIVLGFDTLEIHGDMNSFGCKWRLKSFLQLGQTTNYNGYE